MLLNRFETAMMNNPVRAAIQRHVEARRLLSMGGAMRGGRALEIGCGRGVGVAIILEVFGAESVDAFDLDPHMIQLATRRLVRFGSRVKLWTGDAEHIDAPDGAYDAVFDFGIVHHVPDWRRAVQEVGRVLRPGGRFYVEEFLRAAIVHPITRQLFDHPQEDRFDATQFGEAIEQSGMRLVAQRSLAGTVAWYAAVRE